MARILYGYTLNSARIYLATLYYLVYMPGTLAW